MTMVLYYELFRLSLTTFITDIQLFELLDVEGLDDVKDLGQEGVHDNGFVL